jgi:hypothetical protein
MITAMHKTNPGTKWYRVPLVWLLLLFPALAVIGGVITWWLATSSFDGLVTDDYYKQGLQINRVIDRDRAAQRYGLTAVVSMDARARSIIVELRGGPPGFVRPRQLVIRLLHATRAGLDRVLALPALDDVRYGATLAPLEPGRWHIQIEADDWRIVRSTRVLSP